MPTEVIVMKKWLYLLSGVVIGAVVATSSSAFAAQVKSLVGQKVTGEYTVVVNGKTLSDKGAVINGRTNAPVRALSDAIGGNLNVDNQKKVISITTEETSVTSSGDSSNVTNESDLRKSALLIQKSSLEAEVQDLQKQKKIHEDKYNEAEEGMGKQVIKQALDSINQQIADKTKDLNKINAELQALEK